MNKTQETKKKKPMSTHKVSKAFSIIMLILIVGSLVFAAWTGIDSYIKYGNVVTESLQNLI